MPSPRTKAPRTKAPTDKARKRMKKVPRYNLGPVAEIPRSLLDQIVKRSEDGNLSTEELQQMIVEFNKEEDRKAAERAEIRRMAREDSFLEFRLDA